MNKTRKNKILFVSSSGGHFSELMCLKETMMLNDSIIATEHTENPKLGINYFLKPAVRTHYFSFLLAFTINSFRAFFILFKERPDLIVSTGSHVCIPFFILSRFFSIKTIYIESFARVNSLSFTCRLIKFFSNKIIVQHYELQDLSKGIVFFGQIY